MARKRSGPSGGTPAITELARCGVDFVTHAYDHDPAVRSYGREAAEALGVDPDRVFKTLLASVDGSLVVAMVPVPSSLDLKALARAVGGRKAEMTPPPEAERATGYVVGGISPIGQRRRHPAVLDESASGFETILVSGGRRGLDIELAPAALAAVTDATLVRVAR